MCLVLIVCRKLCHCAKTSTLGLPAVFYYIFIEYCSWSCLFFLGSSFYVTLILPASAVGRSNPPAVFSMKAQSTSMETQFHTFHLNDCSLCGRRQHLNGSSRRTKRLRKFLIGITTIIYFLIKNSYCSSNHNIFRE